MPSDTELAISDMLQGIGIPIASDSGRRVLVTLLFTYEFRTMNSSQAAVLLLGINLCISDGSGAETETS